MSEARAIKIAVTALGGQGGGVVANWIVRLGEACGFMAQSTSVPGVAQRTGATVYYVELFPESAAKQKGKAPVLALMPVPGDVDIVIAAELMEAGRAIMRGFVTKQTTLIASSHRDFAISEKISMGDGRQGADGVKRAAKTSAGRFIEADMAGAAASSGAVISAVLFGALAASGALPFAREKFEETIRASGRAVENNLRGFAKGFEIASAAPGATAPERTKAAPPAPAVRPLLDRLENEFPAPAHFILREGVKRAVDYQDVKYAHLYLDRIRKILAAERDAGGAAKGWRLTEQAGKHLALWMTYEDSIRVADLKTRASRFRRLRNDVHAKENQIVNVSEYLHPRVEEFCDILPAALARSILKRDSLRRIVKRLLGGGRRISTTKLRGFLPLRFIALLRFMRRSSYRFRLEQGRIDSWLSTIQAEAPQNYALAVEIARLQRLIKGYGETHERGLGNFNRIMAALDAVKAQENPAEMLASLREAALKDEDGAALTTAIANLQPGARAA